MPDDRIAPGTVWLVGAGPGDPELLTRKAERLIREASIVFYDALVGPEIVALIPPHVTRVYVGKRAGRHSKDQKSINDLLVEAALRGENVVRLKGGDPAIFGRATEEMQALAAHGIKVSICPGITAASAAAASLGISLTQRGAAQGLTFVTAHARAGGTLDIDWSRLADPNMTAAIYMGKASAGEVAAQLIAAGLPGSVPVAVVANASLPGELLLKTRLDLLAIAVKSIPDTGPAILLIGNAVADHHAGLKPQPSLQALRSPQAI